MSMIINDAFLETFNGEDFIVWNKELCAIEVDNKLTEFKRLEFLLLANCGVNEPEYVLDHLEPTIYDKKPALILHCHLKDKN